MNTDHAKCNTCELDCSHCGSTQTLAPIPVACLVDVVRGFLLMHRRCEKPIEPSKQVELFGAPAQSGPVLPGRASDMLEALRQDDKDGIDGNTDEPAPEIDPPGGITFNQLHPPIVTREALWDALYRVLPAEQYALLTHGKVEAWHPAQGKFSAVAHWARVDLAHNASIARGLENGIPGLVIPARVPMPEVLMEALGIKGKPARGKRGARPFSSPSADMPAAAPKPKTRKRRSGSTQHTS